MQVFKTYFKIVRKNIAPISIYFFVFLFLSILLVNQRSTTGSEAGFSDTKIQIAVFNNDANSEFSKGFEKFLAKHAEIINIPDDKQSLQDALYFRKVVYIVRIPNGFSEAIMNGSSNMQIEKTTIAGSTSSIYIDFLIDKYMNSAKSYINNIPNITNTQLNNYLDKDMSIEANVKIQTFGEATNSNSNLYYYFKYFAYAIFAIVILGVTTIILTFNNTELKKRNIGSPIKLRSYNFQIILGSFVFTIVTWGLLCLISIILYGNIVFSKNTILLFINALIISLVVLSVSFLLGNVMKSKEAVNSVSNILTLGLSFLSGVFVPQEFMSASVLKIASFTPTYWYVKAVDSIKTLTIWSNENILQIVNYMLIELIFAIAILGISLVIVKQKRASKKL